MTVSKSHTNRPKMASIRGLKKISWVLLIAFSFEPDIGVSSQAAKTTSHHLSPQYALSSESELSVHRAQIEQLLEELARLRAEKQRLQAQITAREETTSPTFALLFYRRRGNLILFLDKLEHILPHRLRTWVSRWKERFLATHIDQTLLMTLNTVESTIAASEAALQQWQMALNAIEQVGEPVSQTEARNQTRRQEVVLTSI